MTENDIKSLKDKILKEQKKVATSKVAAVKYLIKLGVLTKF
jgi:hypothetical protein